MEKISELEDLLHTECDGEERLNCKDLIVFC